MAKTKFYYMADDANGGMASGFVLADDLRAAKSQLTDLGFTKIFVAKFQHLIEIKKYA